MTQLDSSRVHCPATVESQSVHATHTLQLPLTVFGENYSCHQTSYTTQQSAVTTELYTDGRLHGALHHDHQTERRSSNPHPTSVALFDIHAGFDRGEFRFYRCWTHVQYTRHIGHCDGRTPGGASTPPPPRRNLPTSPRPSTEAVACADAPLRATREF